MSRKKNHRIVQYVSPSNFPESGKIRKAVSEFVVMDIDELEAIRLADLEGMYHEEGARSMGVSRQTFGRILREARQKVAMAVLRGKPVKITGQDSLLYPSAQHRCAFCPVGSNIPTEQLPAKCRVCIEISGT